MTAATHPSGLRAGGLQTGGLQTGAMRSGSTRTRRPDGCPDWCTRPHVDPAEDLDHDNRAGIDSAAWIRRFDYPGEDTPLVQLSGDLVEEEMTPARAREVAAAILRAADLAERAARARRG
jgi:hypothetical protein